VPGGPWLLAQAFGEYGALWAIVSSFESACRAALDQLSMMETSTWAVLGFAALALLFLWNRR
jgi:hypothetical protein